MVDAPAGSRVIALVHRQAGKTTGGAVGAAHTMTRRRPGSTSLALAPTQRQSAELILKVRAALMDSGERLAVDNAFSVALDNGSRCLALPGADDAAIRGLSIDGDLIVDEAARVVRRALRSRPADDDPARRDGAADPAEHGMGQARIFLSRSGLMATRRTGRRSKPSVEECRHISAADLERERRSMSAAAFAREYENQFDSVEKRFFDVDAIASAFGGDGLSPPPPDGDPDPVVAVAPAFRRFA